MLLKLLFADKANKTRRSMKYACPCCNSKSTRNMYVAYMSGTSEYSGISTKYGISIGRRRVNTWLGRSSCSGKRQNLFAKKCSPPNIFQPILLFLFMLFINKILAFGFVGIWIWLALEKYKVYETQWVCLRCGVIFIPNE